MQHKYGAVWEASSLPDPPLSLRITTADGQAVVARRAPRAALSGGGGRGVVSGYRLAG